MTMAASGSINLVGGSSSPQRSIAAELGVSAPLTLRTASVLLLANRASNESCIMPTHFYGLAKVTYPCEYSGNAYSDTNSPPDNYGAGINVYFYTDGTFNVDPLVNGLGLVGNWCAPTATSRGRLFWIRWTRTSLSGTPANAYAATASSGWQNVTSTLVIAITASGAPGVSASVTADYTIEISTNSSGSSIVSTSYITLSGSASGGTAPGVDPGLG